MKAQYFSTLATTGFLCLGGLAATPAAATVVGVTNGDFELPDTNFEADVNANVPGWSEQGGRFTGAAIEVGQGTTGNELPTGNQWMFLNDGFTNIWTTIGTVTHNELVQVSFDLANSPGFDFDNASFNVFLVAGGLTSFGDWTNLDTKNQSDPGITVPTNGNITSNTVTFDTGTAVAEGENLGLFIWTGSAPDLERIYIDNVTAVPEPGSLALLGLGGLLIARRRRG